MIGSTIVYLDCVDSTNNYAAKELLTKSLKEGTVFSATCQLSGRGQGSAAWESAAGLNLTFSIVLYPLQVGIAQQFSLSKAIALGVADFLSGFTDGVTVKWPNDIYVGDKKIAGILIETAISSGKISRAIVGIGLNINQEIFLSDAPNPVSLKNLTGIDYDLTRMLQELCQHLDSRYRRLLQDCSSVANHDDEPKFMYLSVDENVADEMGSLHRDYQQKLYRKNIWAKYHAGGEDFEGMITGVASEGRLMIQTRSGDVRSFQFKEVEFR